MIITLLHCTFFHSCRCFFHGRFEWQQVYSCFETILCILADLKNAVVWTDLILPLISNSFSLLSKHLRTIPRVLTTICPHHPHALHLWNFSSKIKVLFYLLAIFYFHLFYHYSLSVFPTSVNWCTFAGVWERVTIFKSLGFFSVFWPMLTMLKYGWSLLVLWFPSLLFPLANIWRLFGVHQIQLIPPSLSCSIAFLVLWQGLSTYLSFHFILFLLCRLPWRQCPLFGSFSPFLDYHKVRLSGRD